MADSTTLMRRGEPGGLGLGSLLAIALGGGAVVFMAIGLLLAWRINSRRQPWATRVYARSVDDLRALSTRLTKRRLLDSASGLPSGLSSRLSLTAPPVLPPLPTHNSFNFFRAPSRRQTSQGWADGGGYDGPKTKTDKDTYGNEAAKVRDCRPSKDGRLGRVRTLPNLGAAEKGELEPYRPETRHYQAPPRQQIEVQKRQSRTDLAVPSQTAPANLPPTERVRVPARAHVRPSVTDTDLRDILRSTDQRLREGHGRPPVVTPRSSPAKSCRTPSSRGTARTGGSTPSPTKRSGGMSASATRSMSRDASATSIGSAANSLIAEATQQLELPSAMSSPSRPRGREWEPQLQGGEWQSQLSPLRSPQRSPERPRSGASDASSSLSTLYSVGESEDERGPRPVSEDPFVERGNEGPPIQTPGRQPKQQPSGPRPLRRVKTISPQSMCKGPRESPMPKPLRPISANSQYAMAREGPSSIADLVVRWPIVLQPPTTQASEEVCPKEPGATATAAPQPGIATDTSESSFTSESVRSDDGSETSETPTLETPKLEWLPSGDNDGSRSPTVSPQTPTRSTADPASDASSSPYNEQDILSMLLASSSPRRALPYPPTTAVVAPDGSVVSTPLTPRPRDRGESPGVERKTSGSSSHYSAAHGPAAVSTGSPSRRPTVRPARGEEPQQQKQQQQSHALGSTIAELRRMNSMISSYSAASIASTAVGGDLADSPTLPSFPSGDFANVAPRVAPRPGAISSRHYLNMGRSSPVKRRGHRKSAPADCRPGRAGPGALLCPSNKERGKENQGLGPRAPPRPDGSAGLKEARRSENRSCEPPATAAPAAPAPLPAPKARLGPVKELAAEEKRHAEKRDSVESLGMYDNDGFLLPSPDREARKRCLRM